MSDDLSTIKIAVTSELGNYQWEGNNFMEKIDGRVAWRPTLAALALALGGCASYVSAVPPVPQPAKPPQVVYRIDDHRYFELTPDETCFGNMLYFIDTAKGIRSEVVIFDAVMNRTTLVIDAANDQYLVAPVTRGGINCSSGGGACGGDKMPYSTDGGRTWQRVWAHSSRDSVMISGAVAYNVDGLGFINGLDLTLAKPESNDWRHLRDFVFEPRVAPIDVKVLCKAQGGNLR
uniref:T6SS immunity protein Tli3 family protein n=1 Tax=unclassified Variovorax TaxID=663243 RepID=UPI000D398194